MLSGMPEETSSWELVHELLEDGALPLPCVVEQPRPKGDRGLRLEDEIEDTDVFDLERILQKQELLKVSLVEDLAKRA